MILVTGAAGKTGRAIIETLIAKGQPIRALVRRKDQADELEQIGVVQSAVGDMTDQSILSQVVEGVTAIYHICPNMHPQEMKIGENIIAAAEAAGVRRFVYHSVLHPQVEAMPHHWHKMRVEEMLFTSKLSFTILQPAAYMQNILANWDSITREGIHTVPYVLETRMSLVDLQDVAEVAARVLTEPGHAGATYELCGSEVLSQHELVAIISRTLGREVKGIVLPLDQWQGNARRAGMSDYAIDTLSKMFRYYNENGFWGSGRVLTLLLGRPPTPFAEFLSRVIS